MHHRPVVLGGNVDEVEAPALRNEQSEVHDVRLYASVSTAEFCGSVVPRTAIAAPVQNSMWNGRRLR